MEPYVTYTIIISSFLVALIVFILLYDIWRRYRDMKHLQVIDGGPPATPSTQSNYTITVQVEEISATFDPKQTILRFELLNDRYHYLTSLAIPCFVFKFKTSSVRSQDTTTSIELTQQPHLGDQLQGRKQKSLSYYHEVWSPTSKSRTIHFNLVRRHPLHNLCYLRVNHDCYYSQAHLTLRQFSIKDDIGGQVAQFDVRGKQIFALHPCPPSSAQVFTLESSTASELKSDAPNLTQVVVA